jgi:Flp pilus assembly protein TadG
MIRRIGSIWARFRDDRKGLAFVEFALVAPIMLVLFIAVAEGGRVLHHHSIITKGVRDASRYLARMADPLDPVHQTTTENLVLRGAFDGAAPLLLGYCTSGCTVAITTAEIDNSGDLYRDGPTVTTVTVTATVAYRGGFFPGWWFDSATLTATHNQRHIGE